MEKISQIALKTLALTPYLLVQVVTRGGDWAIQNYIIYTYHVWALPAQIAGALFNVLSGYVLQKIVVFPQIPESDIPKMRKQFGTFLVLRACLGIGAFLLLNILFVFWPQQYLIYSGVVTVLMWFYSYHSQRDVFKATLRDLPRPIRKTREIVLRPKNTGRRIIRKIEAIFTACKI